jgi:hypothetical protein
MDPLDDELAALNASVRASLLQKEDRSRHRRMLKAARELALKPGTKLGYLMRHLDELPPEDFRRVEDLIYSHMIYYCLNTRIGTMLSILAEAKGEDPPFVLAAKIQRAAFLVAERRAELKGD